MGRKPEVSVGIVAQMGGVLKHDKRPTIPGGQLLVVHDQLFKQVVLSQLVLELLDEVKFAKLTTIGIEDCHMATSSDYEDQLFRDELHVLHQGLEASKEDLLAA